MTAVTQAHSGGGAQGHVLSLARCALRSLSGPRQGQEVIIEGDCFRIGKSPDNDLVIADATVSREHCEIVRDDKGYLLRDLGSTNGTLLDGAEIREGYLRSGVVISVGRVELQVRPFEERIDVAPSPRERFGDLVGQDPSMRTVFGLLERLAPSDATLLIGGETGTGKDLLARAVHAHSKRARGPFVVVDCGAVVASLIESELFGHEKGAFTGASDARKGAFELAQKGTLFLDEIGELPLSLQPKLLRALETRRIRRVGGEQEIPLDLRVVAASNRDLPREVERGKFREDLYFRLSVVPVRMPPLRERRDDIPLLSRALLARLAEQEHPGEPQLLLSEAAAASLRAHDWPGNVRELRNVLERAALLSRAAGETVITSIGLPVVPTRRAQTSDAPPKHAAQDAVQTQSAPSSRTSSEAASEPRTHALFARSEGQAFDPARSYGETKRLWENDFEQRYVSWLLERHAGNLSSAAREAGMDRKYLHKLAKKHGLRSGE